jgi:hypothetical protein
MSVYKCYKLLDEDDCICRDKSLGKRPVTEVNEAGAGLCAVQENPQDKISDN